MRIGIDVDGVLADFAKRYLDMARDLFNHNPDPEANPTWDFNLSNEQTDVLWKQIKGIVNFWCTLQPYDRWPLPQAQHTLIFITSRVSTAGGTPESQTAWWLHNVKGIIHPTVLVVNHWHEKSALYRDLKLDAFIDDKVDTVQQFRKHKQNCYVYAQPWNRKITDKRVTSMQHFFDEVEREYSK
jgi:uncharacterized HAD superfamily protein